MTFADPLFEIEGRGFKPLAGGFLARAYAQLESRLEAERTRLVLWLPVGIAFGIGLYFALPTEPGWGVAAAVLAAVLVLLRFDGAGRLVLAAPLMMAGAAAVGFLAADVRTSLVAAPVLSERMGPVRIEGTIRVLTHDADDGTRLLLAVRAIEGIAPDALPARVRLAVRAGVDALAPGDTVAVRAVLRPPSGPAAPGAYDFARRAYFEQIGAVGFALNAPERLSAADAKGGRLGIERLRVAAATRIESALEGATAGVAVALTTGLRAGIPDAAMDDLRDSGLAHIISISGLHMSLVAFGLFAALRLSLVLVPGFGLGRHVKKVAAGLTLIGAFFYMLFTGASIPTQRAFIMVALVLLAIIADRRALTMRTVAIAALFVLLIFPESLLDAGFQMSFAAVIALIAAYEAMTARVGQKSLDLGWLARLRRYTIALVMTSLVAGLATAPFAAFHFQRIADLSLLANLLGVPVTSFLIMPSAMLSLGLMPFGIEGPAVWLLGESVDLLLGIAAVVADLPGAVQTVKAADDGVLVLMVVGGLWLCLWQTRWRWVGLAPMAVALALWAAARGPDLVIDSAGATIAVREPAGALVLARGQARSYDAALWLRRDGQREDAPYVSQTRRCDALGCTLALKAGGLLAVSENPGSLGDDCMRARVLITQGRPVVHCAHPQLVIDGLWLRRAQGLAVWLDDERARVVEAVPEQMRRPWTPARPRFRNSGE